jgi:Xaa-Pro aminopeptidase
MPRGEAMKKSMTAGVIPAVVAALALLLGAAEARVREPNDAYAERRTQLRARVDGPVVLLGFTGREVRSPSFVFQQEQNFYYLTGHNEPGAALVIVPEPPSGKRYDGPREILFLPVRDATRERWDGARLAPGDPHLAERTGFTTVLAYDRLATEMKRLAEVFPVFHTLLPSPNFAGFPHEAVALEWLKEAVPRAQFRDVARVIGDMRQVKMPSELELLVRATELSMDAHLEALRMLRPGLYEYEVAARMEYTYRRAGCEGSGYAPIVASGPNSTVLHYNELSRRIAEGDVVKIDVGAMCEGYVADITRTLPASGKFTARQREIYDAVYQAQEAVFRVLKPGMTLARTGPNSLYQVALNAINSHPARDRQGRTLGRYFIHGLGHHVGLHVHDAGDPSRLLQPGMVVTIEPGIYIPEEDLGVRIEDIVLITEDGYRLLTARLPRAAEEVERVMAEARRDREQASQPAAVRDAHPPRNVLVGQPGRSEEWRWQIPIEVWTPSSADYRVMVFRSWPTLVFIIDGDQVFRFDTGSRALARLLEPLPAAPWPRDGAALLLEQLAEDTVEVARVVLSTGYGTGVGRLGWKVTRKVDGKFRTYEFWHAGDATSSLVYHLTANEPPR